MLTVRNVFVIALAVLVLGAGACSDSGAAETSSTVTSVASASTVTSSTGAPAGSDGVDVASLFDVTDWIAFQGPRPNHSDGVFLVHPDDTDLHEVGADVGAHGLPDWSPDGSKVVFTTRGGETEPLFVYDVASDSSSRLFSCDDPCVGDDEPSYSRDGATMVFIRALGPFVDDVPSDCGLWIGDLSSGDVTQVTSNPGCDREYQPRLTPDGAKIMYQRESQTAGSVTTAVFVFDVVNGSEVQLTDWDMVAGAPDWSPDGEWIVFSTYPMFNFEDGDSDLYRMRPDGSGTEQLTFFEGERAGQPRYTPDGQWIVFTLERGLVRETWVIPSAGGDPIPVLVGGIHTHPAWQPSP